MTDKKKKKKKKEKEETAYYPGRLSGKNIKMTFEKLVKF